MLSLQWFKTVSPLTDELNNLFWAKSQGIVSVATLLFYLCQVRAVISGKDAITPKLINDVYNEELRTIHPMIEALKSGREDEINQYQDLVLPRIYNDIKSKHVAFLQ